MEGLKIRAVRKSALVQRNFAWLILNGTKVCLMYLHCASARVISVRADVSAEDDLQFLVSGNEVVSCAENCI